MNAETILYVVIAGVVALALTIFMYGYKTKLVNRLKWVVGVLRFLSLFAILLLLINPKFRSDSFSVEKPKLPVLIDNSASIDELDQTANVLAFVDDLKSNSELNDKFDLSFYSFGDGLNNSDTLTFTDPNTNVSKALKSIQELYDDDVAPSLLISDGNQTLGSDYEYLLTAPKNAIYPIILGDSIKYTDLKIEQLNTNKYAFLKNQFPVEAILVYNGTTNVNSQFVVTQGASTVYREDLSFSEIDNTKTIYFTLPANSVGLQKYMAQILPLSDEKNRVNNNKRFAVEVIDQATNVLVVSKLVHPDLGALKKAITSNEQRTVNIQKPNDALNLLNDHQLVILYQPDRGFTNVISEIAKLNKNVLTITGLRTDWNFLNSVQEKYVKEASSQYEDVTGELNINYGTFAIENIGFDDFPPLRTKFGDLSIQIPYESILNQSIDGFTTEGSMLATMELNGQRDGIWDGEGFWKWRAQSYLNSESFEDFDNFIGKLVQYLASNKRRSRLEVSNETFYYNNNPIRISAQYFDNNFVFDSRVSLQISIMNDATNERTIFPLLLRNNYYEVDLNSLAAGEYRFTVSVQDEAISRSGNFTILDFNVEQQFLNADVTKLHNLATNTNGKAFFITQTEELLENLLTDDRFRSIQKSEQKIVPLIDWKYLLAIVVLALASEWFIRKYNGLI